MPLSTPVAPASEHSAGRFPDDIATYLRIERALDLRVAEFAFDLYWDRRGICLPIEGRVKRRNIVSYDATSGRAESGSAKMLWLDSPSVATTDEPLPPYPSWRDLRQAELIVEGEFDAMVACANGFLAASGTAGAGTWTQEWTDALSGRCVTLLYDNDDAGRKGALKAGESLTRGGCQVRIASWPTDRPDGWDMTDHFRTGGSAEEIAALLASAIDFVPSRSAPLRAHLATPARWIPGGISLGPRRF